MLSHMYSYFAVTQCHVEVSGNPLQFSENIRKFSETSGEILRNFPTPPLPIPTHPTHPNALDHPQNFKLIFLEMVI